MRGDMELMGCYLNGALHVKVNSLRVELATCQGVGLVTARHPCRAGSGPLDPINIVLGQKAVPWAGLWASDDGNYIHSVRLACQPISQQCFSLTLN